MARGAATIALMMPMMPSAASMKAKKLLKSMNMIFSFVRVSLIASRKFDPPQ
jgi:hypothetical protein